MNIKSLWRACAAWGLPHLPRPTYFLSTFWPSQPWPPLQTHLGTQGTNLASCSFFASLLPSAPSSHAEELDHKALGSYELFAASVGHADWLRLCLNQNTGETPTDSKGFSAIHCAAQQCKLQCLQVLLEEYNFPVNQRTHLGQTPLHLLIRRDNETVVLPCVQYLLLKDADINAQTKSGCTPLHLAAREGLLGCVKVLVAHGADVHAQDVTGCKPIDLCKIWNHRSCGRGTAPLSSRPTVRLCHSGGDTFPLGSRFLKDAMWKRDKNDLNREMGVLKRLKGRLACMEQWYLTKYQNKCQVLNDADFKNWLQRKMLPAQEATQEPGTSAPSTALLKLPRCPGVKPAKIYHPFLESRLKQSSLVGSMSVLYRPPVARQPRPRVCVPATQQGLGVQPVPTREHDFCNFVRVCRDGRGGSLLYTLTGRLVTALPQLPFEMAVQELHPSLKPHRLKGPGGFHPLTMKDVPQKRRLGTFWTDTLAMNLQETFDETFLSALRAHHGLPILPAPKATP
ncbi:ankyrin repeat domain-containing protein 53 [Echinops telfairi]|uniref:Ankyrin repeat domain-containing protein 53 n=1 Tax=Echinops telfairi TaxID=9371 RepID=A0AC55DE43_ECHTE|nr:ankyrin repeat domain-containing protein 53 [Echinops telfairi]